MKANRFKLRILNRKTLDEIAKQYNSPKSCDFLTQSKAGWCET